MSEYFKTSDGTPFFKEEAAKTHARTLKDKNVKTVSRSEEPEESEETKPETAKDIIAKVSEMNLETTQDYLTAEEAMESPRTTVVTALQKRITELQNPA